MQGDVWMGWLVSLVGWREGGEGVGYLDERRRVQRCGLVLGVVAEVGSWR